MGFDLTGLVPKNKTGEYFRNNCWFWRRLADFVLEHVEMPEKEKKYWQSNDGQKVSEETALRISAFLNQAMKEKGKYKKWIKESETAYLHNEDGKMVCYHLFLWGNVRNFAKFCENSGGFEIF